MIAVSNTTPLRYLIAIEQEEILGRLFEKVFIPRAVYEELTDVRTPSEVRKRVQSLSGWFEVRPIVETHATEFPVTLHRGELEAILLAESLNADVLLIDEQVGRAIAMGRNLPLSGTLGVLERADMMGLVSNFPEILRQLKTSGFYFADSLEQRLLQRHSLRRAAQ